MKCLFILCMPILLFGCDDPKTNCKEYGETACKSHEECVPIVGFTKGDKESYEQYLGCRPADAVCDGTPVYTYKPDVDPCFALEDSCAPKGWSVCTGTECEERVACHRMFCDTLDEAECDYTATRCVSMDGSKPDSPYQFIGCVSSLYSGCSNMWSMTWDPETGECWDVPQTCAPLGWEVCVTMCERECIY